MSASDAAFSELTTAVRALKAALESAAPKDEVVRLAFVVGSAKSRFEQAMQAPHEARDAAE